MVYVILFFFKEEIINLIKVDYYFLMFYSFLDLKYYVYVLQKGIYIFIVYVKI